MENRIKYYRAEVEVSKDASGKNEYIIKGDKERISNEEFNEFSGELVDSSDCALLDKNKNRVKCFKGEKIKFFKDEESTEEIIQKTEFNTSFTTRKETIQKSRIEYAYFKGQVSFKYFGPDLHEEDDEKSHFYSLEKVYDVSVSDIEIISELDYNNHLRIFPFSNFTKDIFVERVVNGESKTGNFDFSKGSIHLVEDIRLKSRDYPNHVQINEGFVNGYIGASDVVIKIQKTVYYDEEIEVVDRHIIATPIEELVSNTETRYFVAFAEVIPPPPPIDPTTPGINRPRSDWSFLGCLGNAIQWIFLAIVAFFVTLPLIYALIERDWFFVIFYLIIPTVIFLFWGISQLVHRFPKFFKGLASLLFGGLGIGILLSLIAIPSLFNFFDRLSSEERVRRSSSESKEIEFKREQTTTSNDLIYPENYDFEVDDSLLAGQDSILAYKIEVSWPGLNDSLYSGVYYVPTEELVAGEEYLKSIRQSYISSFTQVYNNVYQKQKHSLGYLYMMFDSIQKANKLNQTEFAEMVVSLVQSFEYTVVLDESCNNPDVLNNVQIRRLLRDYNCEGNQPFGIKAPLTTIYSLTGDCDTRTLLLYTILKNFNYDVAILNSDLYAHSMLGLNLPDARGRYIKQEFSKYYFWETTSRGHPLGYLPRDFNNTQFWEVALN